MIKTIVCTGDSHTWGQGAKGTEAALTFPAQGGDLRLLSFEYPCYVNLLRKKINAETGSESSELDAAGIARSAGLPIQDGCAVILRELTLDLSCDFIRIQFKMQKAASAASIYIDGEPAQRVDLYTDTPQYGFYGFITLPVFFKNGKEHCIQIKSEAGSVLIYRIETYKGSYAVINSGIGSCTTRRFMDEYWTDYVEKYKPGAFIIEPHTINDWLSGKTPDEYREDLTRYIIKAKTFRIPVLMVTVSPILGSQAQPFSRFTYREFIAVSKDAAQREGIMLADANKIMENCLKSLNEEQKRALLFADNWHVNNKGHEIYAECILNNFIL